MAFWVRQLDLDPAACYRTTIKRHNAKTNRRRVDESSRGVLSVSVLDARELCQKIERWAFAALESLRRAPGMPDGAPIALGPPELSGQSAVG